MQLEVVRSSLSIVASQTSSTDTQAKVRFKKKKKLKENNAEAHQAGRKTQRGDKSDLTRCAIGQTGAIDSLSQSGRDKAEVTFCPIPEMLVVCVVILHNVCLRVYGFVEYSII